MYRQRKGLISMLAVGLVVLMVGCGQEHPSSNIGTHSDVAYGDVEIDDVTTPAVDTSSDPDVDADAGSDVDVASEPDVPEPPPPQPEQLHPCEVGECWHPDLNVRRCRRGSIDENFHTGLYNVHRWSTTVHEGENAVVLQRNAGDWNPAIIIADNDGNTLFDGEIGVVQEAITVELVSNPDGRVEVQVLSDNELSVYVYVTGKAVVEGGFEPFLPTDVQYTLVVESLCDEPFPDCYANGHEIDEPACGWMEYTATEVVPRLQGTRDERLDTASVVAWWSLKEGVYFLQNPIVYSNCNFETGDQYIGPLETCEIGRAWQVGLSAIQVLTRDVSQLEATATALYPGLTADEVLELTAEKAGLEPAEVDVVVNSTDDHLRRSWLVRNSAVGFTYQEGPVRTQCIDGEEVWCFGTGWGATQKFAPDREGAMQAIEDIRLFLDAVAP